jgi:hypothetical protein
MQKTITPDLKAIAQANVVNPRSDLGLEWIENVGGQAALKVQPLKREFNVEDEWLIVLDGLDFRNGVIEFDALGRSEPPQSNFLGITFRVVDERTHDAIYFRPFNFRAEDPERKIHAVQYISHPDYHWFTLRTGRPGQYEQPVNPAPDGDDWFHARIVIERPRVRVYVNHAQEPSLVVDELGDRHDGGIGLWVGPGRGGYFANLQITPAG